MRRGCHSWLGVSNPVDDARPVARGEGPVAIHCICLLLLIITTFVSSTCLFSCLFICFLFAAYMFFIAIPTCLPKSTNTTVTQAQQRPALQLAAPPNQDAIALRNDRDGRDRRHQVGAAE